VTLALVLAELSSLSAAQSTLREELRHARA